MTRQEIGSRLKELMKRASPVKVNWDGVAESTDIATIGFDSLSILDLVYDVQQEFKIEFDAEELTDVKTVGDLIGFLEKKQKA